MMKFVLGLVCLLGLSAQQANAGLFFTLIGKLDYIQKPVSSGGLGNTFTVGDKTFSNFLATGSETTLNGGDAHSPGASEISVSYDIVGATTYILFSGFSLTADAFATGDRGQADLTLTYDVSALAGHLIKGVDLEETAGVTGTQNHAIVDESITPVGVLLGVTVAMPTNDVSFSGVSSLSVKKDANVLALNIASAHISAITNSFHQTCCDIPVPEPTSVLLLGCIGGLGLVRVIRRKVN